MGCGPDALQPQDGGVGGDSSDAGPDDASDVGAAPVDAGTPAPFAPSLLPKTVRATGLTVLDLSQDLATRDAAAKEAYEVALAPGPRTRDGSTPACCPSRRFDRTSTLRSVSRSSATSSGATPRTFTARSPFRAWILRRSSTGCSLRRSPPAASSTRSRRRLRCAGQPLFVIVAIGDGLADEDCQLYVDEAVARLTAAPPGGRNLHFLRPSDVARAWKRAHGG